jgi:hypothetical protein
MDNSKYSYGSTLDKSIARKSVENNNRKLTDYSLVRI